MKLISRLGLASDICRGKTVLDIGGRKMPGSEIRFPRFSRAYDAIRLSARDYRIVDVQKDSAVDYSIDLNTKEGVQSLAGAIAEFSPEVLLCMETLEHINYHFEVMNVFAAAIEKHSSMCMITLPNSSNWIVNNIMGIQDHSVAFFKEVARRFVTRSDLGKHRVAMFGCTGMYSWYWPMAYVLSGFQPTSWGFLIGPRRGNAFPGELAARLNPV